MNGITWRKLRELIDQVPETELDRGALICTSAECTDDDAGPYMVMDLAFETNWCAPLIIMES